MSKDISVLFDLDGTLIDTSGDMLASLDVILERYNQPTTTELKLNGRVMISYGANGLLSYGFGDQYHKFDRKKLRSEYLEHYENNLCNKSDLFHGFNEVLEQFQSKNISWGIVTNKPAYLAFPLVEQLCKTNKWLKQSKCLIAADSLPICKPHTAGLLLGAAHLRSKPENTLYVGDAKGDMTAANQAKMTSVIAAYGFIDPSIDLDTWNGDYKIHSASELLKYI